MAFSVGSATPARQLLKGASMIAMTVIMLVLGAWLILYLANENNNDSIPRETREREPRDSYEDL